MKKVEALKKLSVTSGPSKGKIIEVGQTVTLSDEKVDILLGIKAVKLVKEEREQPENDENKPE